MILSHQPAAYWRLGEPDGAPEGIVSETDPATSLTLLGGVAGVAGAIVGDENTAFELTGDNQGFEAANASLFDYDELEPFSLETWFRPTTVSATTRYLFCKQNVGTDTTRYGLYFNDGGGDRGLVFERVIDNDKRYARVPATVVTLDVWHHVVATYNGDSLALYLDGTIAASYVDVRPTQATTERLFVGKKSNTTGLRGGLDEVAIYPHALSSNQVREHWQMGAGVR